MHQCPSCKSWSETDATFCSQCGARLEGRARPGRHPAPGRKWRRLAGMVLVIVGAIGAILWISRPLKDRPGYGNAGEPRAGRLKSSRPEAREGSSGLADPGSIRAAPDEAPEPLSADAAKALVLPALVLLELRGDDDRPLRTVRGIIVDSRGIVLCRFRPLLGAYHGICRLSSPREARVEIIGLSYREEVLDIALIRIAPSAAGYPMVPILEEPPAQTLERGDAIHVFPGTLAAAISETRYRGPDGAARLRIAEVPGSWEVPVSDVFLALDSYGYILGLLRFELEDGRMAPPAPLPPDPARSLIDPANQAAKALDLEAGLTLYELTKRLYEGTFPDYLERGLLASRRKEWREAIDLLEKAFERVAADRPEEEDVQRMMETLRESYHQEIARLHAGSRLDEAAALAEMALARFPDEQPIMVLLGEMRFQRRDWIGGIQALAQAREIESSEKVENLLAQAYLELAADSTRAGDTRGVESSLLEGIRALPASALLKLELAKLYSRFEAYDDAIRLLQEVQELDPALRPVAQSLLDRIDDALKRRDAVIIPFAPDSRTIRTEGVIDGARTYTFIIDTGATYTTIPADLAQELGYDSSRAPRLNLSTAGGFISAPLINVQSVNIGGYSVRNLEVLILPKNVGPDVGLLGLNFLRHFKYSVDSARHEFRLERP